MGLKEQKTKWVLFLSSSEDEPEDRHVYDLVFGLLCLEKAGINPENIHIYVDGMNRKAIASKFAMASQLQYEIKQTQEFFTELTQPQYNNMVMFISGHGSESGIAAKPPITPHKLLISLKKSPKLKRAVVYLGQCFAGIFNYVNASKNKNKRTDTEIVFIGATNLYESISSSTKEKFLTIDFTWVANVFLLHVFHWMVSPKDIDGDGKHTIMDSYKYAGVVSNRHTKSCKANGFGRMVDHYDQLKRIYPLTQKTTGNLQQDAQHKLIFSSIEANYNAALQINYLVQECWILNSIPAQHIEI
ncbi:hypothetical protein KW429_17285 [Vibrio fluvialis]|nr:hypothetical protein [Vibrio fluvialis]